MTAREEPPDRLEQLRERHAERLRAAERIKAGLDFPPRLRDRNRFFNSLLNGELNVYERVRPQWLEYKRICRDAQRTKADIDEIVRHKVEREPGYRALDIEVGQEKNAKRACKRLLSAICAARERIARANTTDAPQAVLDHDAREVADRLRTVRVRADALKAVPGDRPWFARDELWKLDIGFSRLDDHAHRKKQYATARTSLGRLEKEVRDLLRGIAAREKEAKARRRRYLKDGQARYGR